MRRDCEAGGLLRADASDTLPFEDRSFDAILCIDAINHRPARPRVLDDWGGLLRPGGRLFFTDPVVISGCLLLLPKLSALRRRPVVSTVS